MIQTVRRFGVMELRLIFALEQRKEQLFTIRDAKNILGSSDASVWNVLKRLRKKKRVIPIQNGVYLFAPMRSGEEGHWTEDAFKTVPSLVNTDDYYIGFVSAMNHWGMTEQLPYVVHVALLRQKRPVEAVQSRFVFVKKKRLGDFVQVKLGGRAVNVSSPEQTILDGLSFPEYSSGVAGMAKAIHFARKEIDWNKLLRLAMKDTEAVRRRLGYVLRLLGFKKQAEELKKSGRGFRGLVWLDPSARKDEFTHDMEWGLKVNVGRERLLEFREGH